MSKIKKAFEKSNAFIGFITAGDPTKEATVEYILEMEKAGADLVEIGIPFSDPTAEGPVIQEASLRALKGGMTTEGVFEIVEAVRKTSEIPLCLMTYLNPVYYYGYEAFFRRCEALGVDGIIIPDLPFEEKDEVEQVAKKYGVDLISLIAPTSQDRIGRIAKEATGFIYIVSSMGVTGVRNEFVTDIKHMVEEVRKVTDVPCAVGFGISTPSHGKEFCEIADGIIVGSAIVKIIGEYGSNAHEKIYEYVKQMKDACTKNVCTKNTQ